MILRILSSIGLVICCFISFSLNAQVTIGSQLEANKGALLDLKEYSNPGSLETSTRGLALPRVMLTDINSMDDFGISGATELKLHTGLIVYNTGSTDICANLHAAGVYIWNGVQWLLLGNNTPQTVTTSQVGINQPNSYMITGKGIISIPVEKAFLIWDGVSWTDDNGTPMFGAKSFTGTESMRTEVVWMDAEDVITDISINSSTINPSSTITVKTGKCGNAVVMLFVNNEALWSWHIWVTPPVEEIAFNGRAWMDRNLGAVSATADKPLSKGLYYQWGRKDPFPYKVTDWATVGEPTLYKPDNTNPTVDKTNSVVAGSGLNLKLSIEKPLSFITSNAFPYDWYSQELNKWDTRWGGSSTKSITDPCPEGWRVSDGTTSSPWGNLVIGNTSDYTTNKGWEWSDAGFYPAAGCRVDANGDIKGVSVGGYYWTSQPNISLARGMYFNSTAIDTWAAGYRGSGFSVRCVKE